MTNKNLTLRERIRRVKKIVDKRHFKVARSGFKVGDIWENTQHALCVEIITGAFGSTWWHTDSIYIDKDVQLFFIGTFDLGSLPECTFETAGDKKGYVVINLKTREKITLVLSRIYIERKWLRRLT